MAGSTIVRWLPLSAVCKQRGFSLAEMLVALLLLAMSISALLQYQRALVQGFSQQWQQREAWRVASQRFAGHEVPGWKTSLQDSNTSFGCNLERVEVSGSLQRSATLTRLRCDQGKVSHAIGFTHDTR